MRALGYVAWQPLLKLLSQRLVKSAQFSILPVIEFKSSIYWLFRNPATGNINVMGIECVCIQRMLAQGRSVPVFPNMPAKAKYGRNSTWIPRHIAYQKQNLFFRLLRVYAHIHYIRCTRGHWTLVVKGTFWSCNICNISIDNVFPQYIAGVVNLWCFLVGWLSLSLPTSSTDASEYHRE